MKDLSECRMGPFEYTARLAEPVPDDWECSILEIVTRRVRGKIELTDTARVEFSAMGAPYKSGRRKGERRFLRGAENRVEVFVTRAAVASAVAEWERSTGKCGGCEGDGKTIASAGISGTSYRECRQCDGTGSYHKT